MKIFTRLLLFVLAGALLIACAHVFAEEGSSSGEKSEKSSEETPLAKEQAPDAQNEKDKPADKPEDVFGPVFPKGKQVYTACNIWYERPDALWCINYKRGKIIPIGTAVTDLRIGKGLRGSRYNKPTMFFTTAKDGQEFQMHFDPQSHPKFTIRDYAKRMFTTKTFAEITKGMTKKEIEAIKEGKLKVGMSKKAVIASWGYPPEHQTKSLDENEWIYWMWRFQKKAIFFDENGKTRREKERDPDEL